MSSLTRASGLGDRFRVCYDDYVKCEQFRDKKAALNPIRWAHGLGSKLKLLLGFIARSDAFLMGTGAIGTIDAARPGSIRLEGVDGLRPRDVGIEATWRLFD